MLARVNEIFCHHASPSTIKEYMVYYGMVLASMLIYTFILEFIQRGYKTIVTNFGKFHNWPVFFSFIIKNKSLFNYNFFNFNTINTQCVSQILS